MGHRLHAAQPEVLVVTENENNIALTSLLGGRWHCWWATGCGGTQYAADEANVAATAGRPPV